MGPDGFQRVRRSGARCQVCSDEFVGWTGPPCAAGPERGPGVGRIWLGAMVVEPQSLPGGLRPSFPHGWPPKARRLKGLRGASPAEVPAAVLRRRWAGAARRRAAVGGAAPETCLIDPGQAMRRRCGGGSAKEPGLRWRWRDRIICGGQQRASGPISTEGHGLAVPALAGKRAGTGAAPRKI